MANMRERSLSELYADDPARADALPPLARRIRGNRDAVIVVHISEVFRSRSVGQFVEVHDGSLRVFLENHSDEMAADESAAACD